MAQPHTFTTTIDGSRGQGRSLGITSEQRSLDGFVSQFAQASDPDHMIRVWAQQM